MYSVIFIKWAVSYMVQECIFHAFNLLDASRSIYYLIFQDNSMKLFLIFVQRQTRQNHIR